MNESGDILGQGSHPPVSHITYLCMVRLRHMPDQVKKIVIEAQSREEAVQKLINQGLVVVSVKETSKKASGILDIFSFGVSTDSKKPIAKLSMPLLQKVSTREVIFFAIQLSTLLKAGVPLLRSLDIIQKGLSNVSFKAIIQSMKKRVSAGTTLSLAIRDYENVFPWVWANMIEVGEATGKLPQCLDEIAAYQESAARIKGKVITAFMYPGILSVAVVCALIFLMIAVVPKFTIIFTEQKLQLPFITQVVIGISNLVRNNFPIVAIFGTVMTISMIYLKKIPKVQLLIDTAVLNLPVFGTIFVNVAVVRFSRSLGTLLRSGVQILRALEISGRLVENEFIETRIKQVAEAVKSGQGLGGQLESKKVFPVFMSQLITVGEESGDLERFLDLLANYYEEGVDTFLARLTTLLEPFLLIFMGGIIGTIVISLFLPIVQLSTGSGV